MTVQEIFNFRLLLLPTPKYWQNLSLEDIDGEQWGQVSGYEGWYNVSNYGRIKSLKRRKKRGCNSAGDKILTQTFRKRGSLYLKVILWGENGRTKTMASHVMVGVCFHQNPENKSEINHKNCIKYENWAANLEWNTRKENSIHAHKMGRFPSKKGENNHGAKLNNSAVVDIYYSTEKSKSLSLKYNVTDSCIDDIRKGRRWTNITKELKKNNQ